jgi:hypothetical protein
MSGRIILVTASFMALAVLLHCSPSPKRGSDPADVMAPEGTSIAADALPETIVAGQTVYVPVYSHIYSRGSRLTFDLTVTLSIRNTDRQAEIFVTRVSYHDMNGRIVREYLDSPLRLGSLASTDFVIEESDRTGGSAPSFIVEWIADRPVSEPIIQSLMIGTMSQQGISFVSNGHVLESR